MKQCKDCKFWESEDRKHSTHGTCDHIGEWPGQAQILTNVDNDSGLSVQLVTLPYFGCTEFEEINEKTSN